MKGRESLIYLYLAELRSLLSVMSITNKQVSFHLLYIFKQFIAKMYVVEPCRRVCRLCTFLELLGFTLLVKEFSYPTQNLTPSTGSK